MWRPSISIAVYLMLFYGVLDSHVVDIHLPDPAGDAQRERESERRKDEQDGRIVNDETKSDEEREKALDRIKERGNIA